VSSALCECRDNGRLTFTNLGDGSNAWWVHVGCGKPRESKLRTLGDAMINVFVGGDLDKKVYALSTILDHLFMIDGYRWTLEVIIIKIPKPRSDEWRSVSARVWRHESVSDDIPAIDQDRKDVAIERQDAREGPTIAERREKLGVSRARLAELAGNDMTHAKIQRIEQDGVRTTAEERAIVNAALDQLEASLETAQ
jgi:hypothetical protein